MYRIRHSFFTDIHFVTSSAKMKTLVLAQVLRIDKSIPLKSNEVERSNKFHAIVSALVVYYDKYIV